MAKKRTVISLSTDNFQKLCTEMQVKRSTAYAALGGRSNSKNAQLIRTKAMSVYGGIETTRPIF